MSSPLGGKRSVKIFLLYLMKNVRIPVDFQTLNDMVMQTDYVLYFDMAECFYELLDDGLICDIGPDPADTSAEPPTRYTVTDKGKVVAEQLQGDVLSTILEESLRCALRFLNFRKNGITTHCRLEPRRDDGTVDFYCSVEQNGRPIYETHLNVDSMARARRMEDNFRAHPENMYKATYALLCGNVNYLFE